MEEKNFAQEIQALEERLRELKARAPETSARSNFSIIFAVIVGALIIGAAILYSKSGALAGNSGAAAKPAGAPQAEAASIDHVRPVGADDHIMGNPDAPVKLVEFSDPECPFCKQFHSTLQQIVDGYHGQVAWVYRHFPLDSLHSKARKEAEALECANELGGNDGFWKYLDRLFEITPSNNGLDPAELPRIAEYAGLDRAQFETCLASGKYAERVARDLDEAQKSGGKGTPYTVIIGKDGAAKDSIAGAMPYYSVKIAVENILR